MPTCRCVTVRSGFSHHWDGVVSPTGSAAGHVGVLPLRWIRRGRCFRGEWPRPRNPWRTRPRSRRLLKPRGGLTPQMLADAPVWFLFGRHHFHERCLLVCEACWDERFWLARYLVRPCCVLAMYRCACVVPMFSPATESVRACV